MGIVRWVLVVLSLVVAVASWWTWLRAAGRDGGAASQPKYQCPMHPSIVSNDPGDCPICGMALEPIESTRTAVGTMNATGAPYALADAGAATIGDAGAARFFCPMHPEVKSESEGRCPVCKMKLEPIPRRTAKLPTGTTTVSLTLDRMQAIGVRTAIASERDATTTIRATASIASPETGAAEVHARTAGFVERIAVRETGVRVGERQELLAIYSPEVYQAEAELLATRNLGDAGDRMTSAARTKLELLGMSSREIDDVVATGKPARAIGIVAPAPGWVTKKNAVLGSYVTPETVLYEIVDLSRVYVVADVFAHDLADVHVGSHARFVVVGRKDLEARAAIDLIYPRASPEVRTVRVRMTIPNDRRELRFLPGQYGTLEIDRPARRLVVVPRDAVVDTGAETYVFVDEGNGTLAPRAVVVGRADERGVEIVEGIAVGDRLVSGATFLVDSESRLRAALTESQNAKQGKR
jgi:Cu(I)/Ag(I) efflux system membrane fusion protein